ncbi:uncharacterized protein [Hemitrygon akajei]|uniref:uncharacterized protein n=1 Tax=Hemitrygon akajei TaxID=2704970 RepID=UPI003BF9D50B
MYTSPVRSERLAILEPLPPLPVMSQLVILVGDIIDAADKVKEEVGLLGSSVLLDPELKVDPSKSEIVWMFIDRSILRHVPGHSLVEPSEQFEFRLHFDTSNGALTVNEAEHGDQGDYTFIVDGQELRIIQLHLVDELSEASIFTNIESLGVTVELTCEVFGDSIVYQWQKNGGEISQRHQLTDENRTLVIPSASSEDCGVYTCITTNPVSSIQTNYTLMLRGLSLKDVILIAVLTAGQVISAPSLRSAVLPDQWSWKTLGGHLGYRFYFLILWICNTLSLIAMYIVLVYWSVVGGLSPLDFVVICVLIVGLQLSSFYINVLRYVTKIKELLKGSQMITIWWKLKTVCDIVLINCFVIAWIVSATTFGLSTTGIVTIVLSIVLPIVFVLIWMYRYIKVYLDKGICHCIFTLVYQLQSYLQTNYQMKSVTERQESGKGPMSPGDSIKDALIKALRFIGLMLPLVNVMILFYLIYKKKFYGGTFFQTIFNLVFLLGISVSNSIPGFYSEDTVTFAASITMVVLLVVAFISFVILWWTDDDTFQRWMSVYNVGFLIVVIIATISWMAFKGLRPEEVGVAITSMVGLVFSAAYAIIFMCWSWKGSPGDKQWWWCLNICNIVALVFILIALICWIVSKDQSCKINIPIWILFTLLGVTFVIALSRFFPVCSRNEGTNENNTDKKQDRGEVQELQTLSPGHEAEPENHPVS